MRVKMRVHPLLPPSVNQTYGPWKFGIYGVFCWVYVDEDGEQWALQTEFINSLMWASSMRPPDCVDYRMYPMPGVEIAAEVEVTLTGHSPDQVINGIPFNLLTGKHVPVTWPPT